MTKSSFAADLLEFMTNWNKIVAAARVQFPGVTEEELYLIVSDAMKHVLRLNEARQSK